jgi:invasion protein IalB
MEGPLSSRGFCLAAFVGSIVFIPAAVIVIWISGEALAADTKQGAPIGATPLTDRLPEAEVASRGLRKMRELTYSPWTKLCFKPSQDANDKTICRTTISGTWDTGQVILKVDLIEKEGESAARLQVLAPSGLYLQPGIKLTIDQSIPLRIPYVICLTNGCIAGTVADPSFVDQLESGKTLFVEVVNPNIVSLATSFPLSEFGKVHRGPPTRIFEQALDEQ